MNKVLTLLLLLFCQTLTAAELHPVEPPVDAPPLQLTDTQGDTHDLQDYRGQVVLVQFWATYCPPCIKEMPSMNRMQAQLADTPFKILAVNMGESQAEVEAFMAKVKPEFTILLDETGQSISDWKVFGAPSNFIVGPQGKVRYTLFGGVEWDDAELITQLRTLAKTSD